MVSLARAMIWADPAHIDKMNDTAKQKFLSSRKTPKNSSRRKPSKSKASMKKEYEESPVSKLKMHHPEGDEEEIERTNKKKYKNKRKRDKAKAAAVEEEKEEEEREPERIRAKVQLINEQSNKTPPLVGYFPSGFNGDECRNDNSSEEKARVQVRVYRNMNEKKNRTGRMELVVSPGDYRGVEFVGTSYSGEAMAPQFCQYAVGVLDKKSQTLKIVPIAANKIFRLEPRVAGSDLADKKAVKEELSAEQQANMRATLDTLYGTKKSLRQSKKMHALKKETDPESQKNLEKKMKAVKVNKEALESATSETILNIPPYDAAATTPEKAYPLEKIILKGEWDFLEDIYNLLQVGSEVTGNAYPSFVCNRIHKLREIKDDIEKKTLSCIFSYITHLMKFKDQHSMDGAASARNHRIPRILHNKFLTKFSDAGSKRLSDDKIHLLISYVLVLTLHADDFHTSPTDIAKDLRMSEVKLRDHFENLGCKLSRENNKLFATLPVPLQFPKAKQRRRR